MISLCPRRAVLKCHSLRWHSSWRARHQVNAIATVLFATETNLASGRSYPRVKARGPHRASERASRTEISRPAVFLCSEPQLLTGRHVVMAAPQSPAYERAKAQPGFDRLPPRSKSSQCR